MRPVSIIALAAVLLLASKPLVVCVNQVRMMEVNKACCPPPAVHCSGNTMPSQQISCCQISSLPETSMLRMEVQRAISTGNPVVILPFHHLGDASSTLDRAFTAQFIPVSPPSTPDVLRI